MSTQHFVTVLEDGETYGLAAGTTIVLMTTTDDDSEPDFASMKVAARVIEDDDGLAIMIEPGQLRVLPPD